MSDTEQETLRLLAVDLDGTLIRTDIGFESFWSAFSRHWTTPLIAALALFRGLPALKSRMRDLANIDVATLPYNQEVIAYIRQWRKAGGRTALVTASNASIASKIADHLQIFDEVHGTADQGVNLKGRHKAAFLEQHTAEHGYAYMGDASADIAVWKKAQLSITVNASRQLQTRAQKVCDHTEHIGQRSLSLKTLAKTVRLHQWLKNLLLFLPMILAQQFTAETLGAVALAFVAFSLTASGIYVINDLLDLADDRAHPRKRSRPVASGKFSIIHATALIPLLLGAGLACALLLGPVFFLVVSSYGLSTIAYSLSWKQIPIIDICALAGFYTIRILAGGVATHIAVSVWLSMFSIFIFFSLGAAKRLAELADKEGGAGRQSARRRDYHAQDSPMVCSMALAAGYIAVLVMALYIDSPDVRAQYSAPQMLWGICPILLFWISRTIMLAHRGEISDDLVVYAATHRTSLVCALIIAGFGLAAALL